LATETIDYYRITGASLKQFMAQKKIWLVNNLTQDNWIDYMSFMRNGRRNNATINYFLRGARVLINYSIKKYKFPKVEPILLKAKGSCKEIYSDTQLQALIKEPLYHSMTETRGWALSCLLLFCPARVKTLCNLKLKDFDFEGKEVRFTTLKNKKTAEIPLSNMVIDILRKYLSERANFISVNGFTDNDYLFISDLNKVFTRNTLYKIHATYNKSRGVVKTGMHRFRNTVAKKMILSGCDVFTLQKWLTHEDLASTKVYVNLYTKDLDKSIDKFNPLEQMRPFVTGGQFSFT
jgi:integrase/recombinase XerD